MTRRRYLQVRDITDARSNLISSATDVEVLLCNICKALITRCLARSEPSGCPFPSFPDSGYLQQLAGDYVVGGTRGTRTNVLPAADPAMNPPAPTLRRGEELIHSR